MRRLQGVYFPILLACVTLSMTAMTVLSKAPPTNTSITAAFAGFFLSASAIITPFIAIIIVMLLFASGGTGDSPSSGRVIAWIPVFLLDCAFVQLVIGAALFFAETQAWQFATIICLWAGLLFLATAGIAGWIAVGTRSFNIFGHAMIERIDKE
ncbi:hypothetical protein CLIM01_14406 [Colletotrichum limetticola]|uniref:MARVEL domain-containing protein n=1 Tax=Colletotrichum limetticola TaxID=1209924 RepID=A0ABQ9P7Y6_9PEZI|nr:hypothetical protein CLIM01_14406 [Colletotrichum limetticola]